MKDSFIQYLWLSEVRMDRKRVDLQGAAHLHVVPGTTLLHPEETVFEAMLDGWVAQMRSRLLSTTASIEPRIRIVRRFAQFTNDYPWKWTPSDLEEWTESLLSRPKSIAHSTVRSYQNAVAMFLVYLTDARYGWAQQCEARFQTHPVQICHEWNMATHANGYEGSPDVRPFSRDELQHFFDHADERVDRARRLGRKGWMAAFRDAAMFKVIYAWGLRRREAARLDVIDFHRNAAVPEFGNYGVLSVRWGKAVKGSTPRRRNVLTVLD
jgi:integrase/recombinase XerC